MTQYAIFKDVTPESNVRKPYRIAETIIGLDGPRTRLTGYCYPTMAEAEAMLRDLLGERG